MAQQQRYEILERIDVGGMAEVFKGKSVSMEGFERLVAIKRIHPNLVENGQFLQMFLDEARLSLSLNHANIVQVFDLGRAGETYFIVMEYVDGTNLKSMLKAFRQRGLVLSVRDATFVMKEVCKALAYSHGKRDLEGRHEGIVHRDVSPPNILLSIEGEVKLTDFGLAKARSQVEETDPGVVKGKFGYLSPEAAYGHDVDVQADVFSAGIVLWEMLAGRRLFEGKTDIKTLELVRRAEIPSLQSLNADVPPELERICLHALERDKSRRYSSARELGKDLSAFLFNQGTQVTAYDISTMVRQALRFTRLEGFSRSKARVNEMVQEEIDRIIRIERDGPRSGRSKIPTADPPAVTVMEDPRTWEGLMDWGEDFDLALLGDAEGGPQAVGVPTLPETMLSEDTDDDEASDPELDIEVDIELEADVQVEVAAQSPPPEPAAPPPTVTEQAVPPAVATMPEAEPAPPEPAPAPVEVAPKTSSQTDQDIFDQEPAGQAERSDSHTVVTRIVPTSAKALVFGVLIAVMVLGMTLLAILLSM